MKGLCEPSTQKKMWHEGDFTHQPSWFISIRLVDGCCSSPSSHTIQFSVCFCRSAAVIVAAAILCGDYLRLYAMVIDNLTSYFSYAVFIVESRHIISSSIWPISLNISFHSQFTIAFALLLVRHFAWSCLYAFRVTESSVRPKLWPRTNRIMLDFSWRFSICNVIVVVIPMSGISA